MKLLYNEIEMLLQNANTICLAVDIWTDKLMRDYIAISANLSDENLNKETIVVDMTRMLGSHCAENIKKAVETIVNKFDLLIMINMLHVIFTYSI